MAEPLANGAPAQDDVEMKEEAAPEPILNGISEAAMTPSDDPISASAPPPQQHQNAQPAPIASMSQMPSGSPAPPAAAALAPPPPAATSRPSSQPPAGLAPPEKPQLHGSPTRVYLNQNVTPHLLEGMKYLAAYEPDKPLRWLSEFLAKRSAELEGA